MSDVKHIVYKFIGLPVIGRLQVGPYVAWAIGLSWYLGPIFLLYEDV